MDFLSENFDQSPHVFFQKAVFKDFAKIHWKAPAVELLFDKVAAL